MSHAHPGLVDILQIGRSDAEGYYFYYVMELADDAGTLNDRSVRKTSPPNQLHKDRNTKTPTSTPSSTPQPPVEPDTYTPMTVATVRRQEGRLPCGQCVELGLALSESIGFLHQHGLVHRDVKPSNIIFVRGVPKLADIGLVAGAWENHSLVGTEGFVAPEGQNSPQGDIYSLGKVPYEAAMGKDRHDFPEPPSDLGMSSEAEALLELNAVIVKACEPDARRRYQSMADLREDLWHLQTGKSVRRRHTVRRGMALAAKIALAVVCVGLVALVTTFLNRPTTSAPRSSQRLEELLLKPIEFSLHLYEPRHFDLSPHGNQVVYDKDGDLFLWDKLKGTTSKLNVSNNAAAWRLAAPRWSPTTPDLIACGGYRRTAEAGGEAAYVFTFLLVNLETGAVDPLGPAFSERPMDLCWQADGKGITYVAGERETKVFQLDLQGQRTVWAGFAADPRIRFGGYSPNGRWLAFDWRDPDGRGSNDSDIWMKPASGSPAQRIVQHPRDDRHPAWGPRGEAIYFVSNRGEEGPATYGLWRQRIDPETGRLRGDAEPIRSFDGRYELTFPKSLTDPPRIGFARRLPTHQIWAAPDGQPEQGAQVALGDAQRLSRDGRVLYYLAQSKEHRGLCSLSLSDAALTILVPNDQVQVDALELSPDGDAIAFCGRDQDGWGLFTVPSTGGHWTKLLKLDSRSTRGLSPRWWSPDGQWLAYVQGRWLCKIRADGARPERLAELHQWEAWTIRWSPDGSALACLGHESQLDLKDSSNAVFLVPALGGVPDRLTPGAETAYKEGLEWHPSGEFLTYFMYGSSGPDGTRDQIRTVSLDGSVETLIDRADLDVYCGAWAPDGERFYFCGQRDELRVYHRKTGTIEAVADGQNASLPRWSGDGNAMVWRVEQSEHSLWIMGVPDS